MVDRLENGPAPLAERSNTTLPSTAAIPRRPESERYGLIAQLSGQLGKRYDPQAVRLDRFETAGQRQSAVLAACRLLVLQLAELTDAGRGIVWVGSVGTGKDHLMAAMLYQAAWRHGIACRWVSAENLFSTLRDAMDEDRTENSVLWPYLDAEVLAISDPLPVQGSLGDWQARVLARLVDMRYRQNKPVWITANALNDDDLRERLTIPIADRLLDGAEVLRCFWPSYRRKSGVP